MVFTLFAPRVKHAKLMASWLNEPKPMLKNSNGTWMVDLKVPDGTHTYQFYVPSVSPFLKDKWIFITDPMASKVTNDMGVIEVRDGHNVTTEYTWQNDHVTLSPNQGLILYELHIAEFGSHNNQLGTLESAMSRIKYLVDLGISAVEIMPVMAFPQQHDWGYTTKFACAVDSSYGNPQQLKAFIDACHNSGIRVILDVVFNHMSQQSPLPQIDFYYWFRDAKPDELSYGPKFDYEHHDQKLNIIPAQYFNLAVAEFWIKEYHIDGFRLDAAKILDNFDFLYALRQLCQKAVTNKPFYLVAECLPEDPAVAGPNGPADGAWHQGIEFAIVSALTSQTDNIDLLGQSLQPDQQGYTKPELVINYFESHDEPTLMQRLADHGITGQAAYRKACLAAVLLFSAVGNPMLYQGQEFGGNRPRTKQVRPLQWRLLDGHAGQALHQHYAWLADLRQKIPALTSDKFKLLFCRDSLLVYQRNKGKSSVIVVVNLRDSKRRYTIPWPSGEWRQINHPTQEAIHDQSTMQGKIGPSGFIFWTNNAENLDAD